MGAFDSISIRAIADRKSTLGPMVIPIDCEAVSSVEISPGTLFQRQSDVDAALGGAPAFKYLQQAWDALPPFVADDVTFDLAAGTHFADPYSSGFACFHLSNVVVIHGATLAIQGQPMSSWTDIVAAQTITANQAGNYDPWVQVSGTPFAGLDLRGQMAVLDNGAYGVIMEHTDDTLHLGKYLSPAPTNGVTTVRVARQSTRLRNALEASPTTKYRSYLVNLYTNKSDSESNFTIQDLGLDYMGGVFALSSYLTDLVLYEVRLTVDHEYQRTQFGITPNGNDQQLYSTGTWGLFALLYDCVGYASDAFHSGRDNPFQIWQATVIAYGCYFGNANGRILIQQGARYAFTGGVIENLGTAASEAVYLIDGADFKAEQLSGFGRSQNIIRNVEGAGIRFGPGCKWAREDLEYLRFENVDGPLLRLYGQNKIDLSGSGASLGLKDGGGNGDVGIEFLGGLNIIHLNAGSDLSGAAGDMRIRGSIVSYSEFEGLGPQDVAGYNVIEKDA